MLIFGVLGNPPFCGSRICVGGWDEVGIRAYRASSVQRDTPPVEDDGPVDSKLLKIAKELEEKYVSLCCVGTVGGRVGYVHQHEWVRARLCILFCTLLSGVSSQEETDCS